MSGQTEFSWFDFQVNVQPTLINQWPMQQNAKWT